MFSPPRRYHQLVLFLLALTACQLPLGAAEEGQDAPAGEEAEAPSLAKLPKPLDQITANILDLEKSGHFKIESAKLGRTRQFEAEALIWTVTVLRPITCAHAQIQFRRVGDVRFYRIEKDAKFHEQVWLTRLYYPMWIDSGAANREILNQDEQFEIWVPLTAARVDRLVQERTNTAIFSHVDYRTELPEPAKTSTFPMPKDRH